MGKVVAVVYGPDTEPRKVLPFQRKLADLLTEMELKTNAILCTLDIEQLKETFSRKPSGTLVIGWGMPEAPAWGDLWKLGLGELSCRQFIAIDLLERFSYRDKPLGRPRLWAGEYQSRKIQRCTWKHFIDGHIVQTRSLYGLKRIEDRTDRHGRNRVKIIVEPGNPDEIAIVRFIFDQYVNRLVNRTQISNMLNAQRITPPGKYRAWNHQNVADILGNVMYIGASRYKDCVKYDVFPALIERSLFFMAQARLQNDHLNLASLVVCPSKDN